MKDGRALAVGINRYPLAGAYALDVKIHCVKNSPSGLLIRKEVP